MFKTLKYKKKKFGYLIDIDLKNKGLKFYTPRSLIYQIASMNYQKNHKIIPHIHHKNLRKNINITSEVLIILEGKLRVDFYLSKTKYIFSKIISKNQILILTSCGHGFKVLKPITMLEIKQGPYNKKKDKLLINQVLEKKIKIVN